MSEGRERPIKVFYSVLSGKFYAAARYKVNPNGSVTITGKKYGVTSDIGAAVVEHALVFTPHRHSGVLP